FLIQPRLTMARFFFDAALTTEPYTLSLHDALPIWTGVSDCPGPRTGRPGAGDVAIMKRCRKRRGCIGFFLYALSDQNPHEECDRDRKSTRLNSSHQIISYAVFCLKKKKNTISSSVC